MCESKEVLNIGLVTISQLNGDDEEERLKIKNCQVDDSSFWSKLLCRVQNNCGYFEVSAENSEPETWFQWTSTTKFVTIGKKSIVFTVDKCSYLLRFHDELGLCNFKNLISQFNNPNAKEQSSVFHSRTEDASAFQYFQFYGYLSQQQNMLQDFVRTHTYQKAITTNYDDFKDKVVLDIGAGSGILSFFAMQAGAKKVYAVEASSMALHAQTLINANQYKNSIEVLNGKIEEIYLPEYVDVIISEPIGYMLFNERMIESYLYGKKWLKPGGKMFPTRADLHVAPFNDESLYMEHYNKATFWFQTCFHGVDISSLRNSAFHEYFKQPIVDTFDIRICLSKSIRYVSDFSMQTEDDLKKIQIPVKFEILESGTCHGLAFWFDIAFFGTNQIVWMSTGPQEPLTHWYQVRCLLPDPIIVNKGQILCGSVELSANRRQSYDVSIELQLEGCDLISRNNLDLKNPCFRYNGVPHPPTSFVNTSSPSENYWHQIDNNSIRLGIVNNDQMTFNNNNYPVSSFGGPDLFGIDPTALKQETNNVNGNSSTQCTDIQFDKVYDDDLKNNDKNFDSSFLELLERIIDIQEWPKIEEKVVLHDENIDKVKVTVVKPTVSTASVESSNSTSPVHFRRKPANVTIRSDHSPNTTSTVANDFGYRPRKRSDYGAELNNSRFSYGFPKPMYQPRARNAYQHGVRLPTPATFVNNNRVMFMSQQQQPPPRADICTYPEQIYVNDCNGTIDVRTVIRNQIDQNLSTDVYLRHNMDENGYVIVTLLMKFRKIKLLTNDILLIIDAIRESDKLELITGDYKVRTKNNPRNWILAPVNNGVEAAIYPSVPPPALNPELIRVLRDHRNINNGNQVVYYQTSG